MIRMLCPEPESFSLSGLDFASKYCDLTAISLSEKQFQAQAPKYEVLLIRFNTKITSSIFGPSSKIKTVISPTTGLDHIDMNAVKNKGVKVFHLKGESFFLKSISGTAEHTIGLMLSVMRKIPQSYEAVKNNRWSTGPFRGNEVAGKTLGVIGCGRLGAKVSRVGVALGMKVIAFDPNVSRFPSKVESSSFLYVLKNADILTMHVPLQSNTRHMISDTEISYLKKGVIIINTSRGSIINSVALLKGLRVGKIAGAALDVLENEHTIESTLHPVISYAQNHDNLLITPHIGGATYESVENTDKFILEKYFKSLKFN